MTTNNRAFGWDVPQLLEVMKSNEAIKGVGKMRALAALQRKRGQETQDELLRMAADKQESPRFRHMAVTGLYRQGGALGTQLLMAAAQSADEITAAPIATGLGRLGAVDSLATLNALKEVAATHSKQRIEFASSLLAYRHNIENFDVLAPSKKDIQIIGSKPIKPIAITAAIPKDSAVAHRALDDEPVDIALADEGALRFECEANIFLLLWNKQLGPREFPVLSGQNSVAGVLFRKSFFENRYSLSAFVLATARPTGSSITVHRAAPGSVLYSGSTSADGLVRLDATNYPGVAAVHIEARAKDGQIEVVTAESAVVAETTRKPSPS